MGKILAIDTPGRKAMIRFERPVYLCADCGKKVRGVNVVEGRNLCRDCTILALRRMDAQHSDSDTAR